MPKPCERCGSDKIIPNVPMWDHIGDMGIRASPARVEVAGNPTAFIFTDKAVGELVVNICGDCGHAELFVQNARALWDKYEHSRQS
jgi:hypothetical protein